MVAASSPTGLCQRAEDTALAVRRHAIPTSRRRRADAIGLPANERVVDACFFPATGCEGGVGRRLPSRAWTRASGCRLVTRSEWTTLERAACELSAPASTGRSESSGDDVSDAPSSSDAGAEACCAAAIASRRGCCTNQSGNRAVNCSWDNSGQIGRNERITGTRPTSKARFRLFLPPLHVQLFLATLCNSHRPEREPPCGASALSLRATCRSLPETPPS